MQRRSAIKNIAIVSGTLISLPAWISSCGLGNDTVHQTAFTTSEQSVLTAITDTIIPKGDAIGAVSVGVDKFLIKLIEDCHPKEVQDNVKKQLNTLKSKSFESGNQQQRLDMLLTLQKSTVKEEKDFFDLIKSETIRGFNTSKEVMQQYLHYEVAPGHYYGCVDAKA